MAQKPVPASRLLCDRDRHAGDLEVDGPQGGPAGKEQRLPIVAAEPDIGGGGIAVNDAAELLALGIEDVDAARAA
jgi:hypothetical protein